MHFLVGKPERKRALVSRYKWECNIRMDPRKIG
jgi:hypothetical protein